MPKKHVLHRAKKNVNLGGCKKGVRLKDISTAPMALFQPVEGVTTLLNSDDPIEKSSMLRPTCSEYKRAKIVAEYQTFKNETFNLFTSLGSWR